MAAVIKPNLKLAASAIKMGGVIVYPSESSYGIGVDATREECIRKIFSLKKRPYSKKLIVIVSDIKMARKYFELTETEERLVKKLMPGPLTLAAKSNLKSVGAFRISENVFARNLAKTAGVPITSTSANISGKNALYKISDVIRIFSDADLIVDAGDLKRRRPTTIYDAKNNKILRRGPVLLKEIKSLL